jgi:hypothetical protein
MNRGRIKALVRQPEKQTVFGRELFHSLIGHKTKDMFPFGIIPAAMLCFEKY